MPIILPTLTVDECPDALGFSSIRVADGSPNGDTEADLIATVYLDEFAAPIAAAPAMLAALRDLLPLAEAEREACAYPRNESEEQWLATIDARLEAARAAIAAATGSPTGGTEAPAASPTDETGDDCEAIRTLEDAAACVRDGLVLLDTVDYVDDAALEDGRLCVVPAEGPAFRVAITMGER